MKTCSMIHQCVPAGRKSDKDTIKKTRKEVQKMCGAHTEGSVHCCLIRMTVTIVER